MRNKKKLLVDQLDRKLEPYKKCVASGIPSRGWIKAIRTVLNMTLEQMGDRLQMTKQGIKKIEEREASGAISIKTLREAGKALDMQLVYGFIPIHGSVDKMIETKARKMATKIVTRTHNTMQLENQGNSDEQIAKAIDELTYEIQREMKNSLWD